MTNRRKRLGARGESIATERISERGWPIVATNWRCRLGEIDIVARDGPTLVIVEVRTRRTLRFGRPEESITRVKQARLVRLGERYIQAVRWPGPWRIDVVAIDLDDDDQVARYSHIESAVEAW